MNQKMSRKNKKNTKKNSGKNRRDGLLYMHAENQNLSQITEDIEYKATGRKRKTIVKLSAEEIEKRTKTNIKKLKNEKIEKFEKFENKKNL